VFSFDRVEGHFSLQGESEGDLHGRIRIHGTERELVVHVRAQVKDGEATAAGRFEIPYVKWGMKDPSTALLSVKHRVTVEGRTTLLRAVRTSRRTRAGDEERCRSHIKSTNPVESSARAVSVTFASRTSSPISDSSRSTTTARLGWTWFWI